VGSQVFFRNAQRICHTGLVYKVDGSRFYTIEGNTSGASGVIANGGGVCRKSYPLGYGRVDGFGYPDYERECPHGENKRPYTEPSGLVRYGDVNDGVKWVQWQLNRHGAHLDADGVFGTATHTAVRDFQRERGLEVDGIVGPETRKALKS
jgi:peptidoglycan hydrolase-like protein with peptidoglycan-binding domain